MASGGCGVFTREMTRLSARSRKEEDNAGRAKFYFWNSIFELFWRRLWGVQYACKEKGEDIVQDGVSNEIRFAGSSMGHL